MGNRLIFPAGPSTYTAADVHNLFWVPSSLGAADPASELTLEALEQLYRRAEDVEWIPCQYFPASNSLGEKHVIIYFHGNSCDLGDMMDEMTLMNRHSGRHIIQFEYPGYGICAEYPTEPWKIDQWGRAVANFVIACGMPSECIVCMGRSIGTGPAARLASSLVQKHGAVGGLVLHSPYISIHEVVSDYAWKVATFFIPNYWDTSKELETLGTHETPLLIVHGLRDEIIDVRHGTALLENYHVPERYKMGTFPKRSEHNSYNVLEDLVLPIRQFLNQVDRWSPVYKRYIVPEFARARPSTHIEMGRHGGGGGSSSLGIGDGPIEDAPNEDRSAERPENRHARLVPLISGNSLTRMLFCGCGSPGNSGSDTEQELVWAGQSTLDKRRSKRDLVLPTTKLLGSSSNMVGR